MLHYYRTQQAIRQHAAKQIDPPGWAGDTGTFPVAKCIDSHFVTIHGETFALELSYEVSHSDRGTIPTKVNRPAISQLGQDMNFPYSATVAHAAADLHLTVAAHRQGVDSRFRVRILHMDNTSWQLAFDDLSNIDEPPIKVHFGTQEIPPHLFIEAPSNIPQLLETAVNEYRNSEFHLPEHQLERQQTNPQETQKRTIFSKLFR